MFTVNALVLAFRQPDVILLSKGGRGSFDQICSLNKAFLVPMAAVPAFSNASRAGALLIAGHIHALAIGTLRVISCGPLMFLRDTVILGTASVAGGFAITGQALFAAPIALLFEWNAF